MSGKNLCLYKNPLWAHIQEHARLTPEKICITETRGATLSYKELTHRVDRAAFELVSKGFSRGDRALFLARSSIDSVVYLLAILRAGGVVVAADPAMGRGAFRSRIALAKPKWIVLEPLLYVLQIIPFLETVVRSFGADIPDTGRPAGMQRVRVRHLGTTSNTSFNEVDIEQNEDALIVYTSGTTSLPKGVVHPYRSILATLDLIKTDLHPESSDVFYASQSYFLLMAFLNGATAILPREPKFVPEVFLHHAKAFALTKAFLLPAEAEELISHCIATKQQVPESVRTIMLGSAPVLAGFLKRFKKILHETTEVLCIYGATEIIPIARISMSEKLGFTGIGDILGKPFTSVHVRIQDDEIIAEGPNIASAYLEGESLREYATGDLGTIDSEGRIVLLGRKKDMIIKGNYNIYPTLFESVISFIPGVRKCAMVGLYNEGKSDEEITLVLEPDETVINEKEFKIRVAKQLRAGSHSIDSYAYPDHIVCMVIPMSGRSRKADKNIIRAHLSKLCKQ